MSGFWEQKAALLREAEKLHHRLELSQTVGPDWYEPGMMEYLDQSEGVWDEVSGQLLLRFEARGLRYDGRSEQLEYMQVGDVIIIQRNPDNKYNPNDFSLFTAKGQNVGNMPAELCNAIAPLYDEGKLTFTRSTASYVEPISKRSRYARQGILFVELLCKISDFDPMDEFSLEW